MSRKPDWYTRNAWPSWRRWFHWWRWQRRYGKYDGPIPLYKTLVPRPAITKAEIRSATEHAHRLVAEGKIPPLTPRG